MTETRTATVRDALQARLGFHLEWLTPVELAERLGADRLTWEDDPTCAGLPHGTAPQPVLVWEGPGQPCRYALAWSTEVALWQVLTEVMPG